MDPESEMNSPLPTSSGNTCEDPAFDYDCPRRYDFVLGTEHGRGDSWFRNRPDDAKAPSSEDAEETVFCSEPLLRDEDFEEGELNPDEAAAPHPPSYSVAGECLADLIEYRGSSAAEGPSAASVTLTSSVSVPVLPISAIQETPSIPASSDSAKLPDSSRARQPKAKAPGPSRARSAGPPGAVRSASRSAATTAAKVPSVAFKSTAAHTSRAASTRPATAQNARATAKTNDTAAAAHKPINRMTAAVVKTAALAAKPAISAVKPVAPSATFAVPKGPVPKSAPGKPAPSAVKAANAAHPAPHTARAPAGPKPLTVPISPYFHSSRRPARSEALGTEDEMLKIIQDAKERSKNLMKLNEVNVQRVVQPRGPIMPLRSTQDLTQPHEFNFRTAQRSATRPQTANSAAIAALSAAFASSASASASAFTPRARTGDAAAAAGRQAPFTAPARRTAAPYMKPKLTQPVSPNFATKTRSRLHNVLSFTELEELEMKSFKPFKARKVSQKMLESCGDIGVPRVNKAPLTQFEEFRFGSCAKLRTPQLSEAEPFVFKAAPFNRKLFEEGVHGVAAVTKRAPTVSQSPNITKPRDPARKKRKSDEFLIEFKAKPMPDFDHPFAPEKSKKSKSVPEPFDLATEERGVLHEKAFQGKIATEEAEAERAREFQARPLFEYSPMRVQPSQVPVTEPQPFELIGEYLSQGKREKWRSKVEKELAEEQVHFSSFRARTVPKLDPPFVKKSEKPLTEAEPFTMLSNIRAEQRKEFDDAVAEKKRLAELEHQSAEQERQQMEAEAVKELRAKLVHKAQPIMRGQPLPLAKSNAPLTVPVSPDFATKKRAEVRRAPVVECDAENANFLNAAH